jgi:hypothetical protein
MALLETEARKPPALPGGGNFSGKRRIYPCTHPLGSLRPPFARVKDFETPGMRVY